MTDTTQSAPTPPAGWTTASVDSTRPADPSRAAGTHQVRLLLDTVDGPASATGRAAIFDCDGLLFDSESVWLDMLADWHTRCGLPGTDLAELTGLSSDDAAEVLHTRLTAARQRSGDRRSAATDASVAADADPTHTSGAGSGTTASVAAETHRTDASGTGYSAHGPVPEVAQLRAQIDADYAGRLAHGAPPMPGAIALVTALAARIPVAVASNGRSADVRRLLASAGLDERIGAIVTVEDVAAGKPAPDVYLAAARALGIDPADCLAFEDSPVGAQAASAAGMIVTGVNPDPGIALPCRHRIASLTAARLYPNA